MTSEPLPMVWPLRADIMRAAALIWVAVALFLLASHLRQETAVGLTAGGTLAFADDTINFWAAPRLALEGRVAEIYDFAKFHAFQSSVLGGPIHLYHYSYPPVAILLTLPLGLLPYLWGVAAWFVGGWVAFAASVRRAWPAGGRKPGNCVLYALAAPAVLVNWMTGQSGTWTASLLGGGLMALDRRPILAGILLGALIAKPQMALLVPVALVAARRWAALAACAATAAVLVLASAALFGTDPWWAFVEREPILRRWILEDGTGVWHLFTSVFVSVRHLPASVPAAYAAQGVSCLAALVVVARAWSAPAPQPAKNALLVMSGFFATPYIQVYDLVVATLAPLWLISLPAVNGTERRLRLLGFIPLLLAPLATPMVAQATGVNIGWLLLVPTLCTAVCACRRRAPTEGA
jgi:hypothetical protein